MIELVSSDSPVLRKVTELATLKEGGEISRKLVAWLRSNNKWATRTIRKSVRIAKGLEQAPMIGLGLSAPQLGIPKRVCVMLMNDVVVSMVNPRITKHSEALVRAKEACLSFPGDEVDTFRYTWVEVETDNWSAPRVFGPTHPQDLAKKLLNSVCAQHEIAHLFGKTIHDFARKDYPAPSDWHLDWKEQPVQV